MYDELINSLNEYNRVSGHHKVDRLMDESISAIASLTAKLEQAEADLKEAKEDMLLIAGESNGALKCNCCKYNPNDMGCELDGSQFDDAGECHFEWKGRNNADTK